MTLALDKNFNRLMTREGLPVGEFRTLADGATEKPVNVWRRLMPHGETGETYTDDKYRFKTGALRSTIIDATGWILEILNPGYHQKGWIKEVGTDSVTLEEQLKFYDGLKGVSTSLEWVVYPALDFPISIRHRSSTDDNNLEIGITKEKIYAPTNVVKYDEIERDLSVIIPTQQIQQIFYKYTGTRGNADSADIDLTWGEHYVRRS